VWVALATPGCGCGWTGAPSRHVTPSSIDVGWSAVIREVSPATHEEQWSHAVFVIRTSAYLQQGHSVTLLRQRRVE
jgi:hypothetical protein